MKSTSLAAGAVLLLAALHASAGTAPVPTQSDTAAQVRVSQSYGRLPLAFEANAGQTDAQVKFLARGPGYTVYLTPTEAVLALRQAQAPEDTAASRHVGANSFARMRINPHLPLPEEGPGTRAGEDELGSLLSLTGEASLSSQAPQQPDASDFLSRLSTPSPTLPLPGGGQGGGLVQGRHPSATPNGTVLRLKLLGANPSAQVEGVDPLPGTVNYFIGNDPSQWRTGVATYSKVRYKEVYSGIDLVYYGNPRQLEHDFIVKPGADPKAIRLAFVGVDGGLKPALQGFDFNRGQADAQVKFLACGPGSVLSLNREEGVKS